MSKMLKTATQQTAEISEIFSSIQGEGPYLGKKQIFVRFGRCNMHCSYCDEVPKMKEGVFEVRTLENVLNEVVSLENVHGPHDAISLTGGEPLMYARFLRHFLPELKSAGLNTYLETNGTLPALLLSVVKHVDIVAMDMKPASSTGDKNFWKEHKDFLEIARAASEVFVKVVVTAKTSASEIEQCIRIVQDVDPKIPFVFQPESELVGISLEALERIGTEFMPMAASRLQDVRVVPQLHKIWGIR